MLATKGPVSRTARLCTTEALHMFRIGGQIAWCMRRAGKAPNQTGAIHQDEYGFSSGISRSTDGKMVIQLPPELAKLFL